MNIMLKYLYKALSSNIYIITGFVIGLCISLMISIDPEGPCGPPSSTIQIQVSPLPLVNPSKRPTGNPKKNKPVRPRYYSTELGIREKLFVGIFTSEEKVNSLAIHLNKTIGHLVDKIKYFMSAQYKLKSKFNLTGLVGFTDTRQRYRPFQVFKYVGDNFAQDYDYYFFANDYSFIAAHKLNEIVRKISVSMDVYLGTPVPESSYCNLDAGIILSNSVLKAVREHLDWCVINAVSDDHSENIGRCIYHSIGLNCLDSIQGQVLDSFKVKHFDLREHLADLAKKDEFNRAIVIHPVLQSDNFYMLNAYFLKQRLAHLKQEIDILSEGMTEVWPPGQKPKAKSATRFDLPRQSYFNMTHMFFPDDFINIRPHTEYDLKDIQYIVDEVTLQFGRHNPDGRYQYRRLVNGYRTFDLSRGLDYILDLGFRDHNTGREEIKRFEVCKPLGQVEFVPVPYVTENTRVTIIFPVQYDEAVLAQDFLNGYAANLMDRKEKAFLMLVLLYQYNGESKGDGDVFVGLKNFATKVSDKYKNEDLKIAWVSVRLPESARPVTVVEHQALNFAVVDLSLKKIGLDSLILVLDVYANITADFLNRVRMNTIHGFQVFSAIPFRQYSPKISQYSNLDVNKNGGHFDSEEYRYISFYSNDYVNARRQYQYKVPLIRVDNDIANILDGRYSDAGNIFDMFLKHGGNIHCMRATEMSLKVKYHEELDPKRRHMFLGSEAQLARLLLDKRDQIPALQ